MAFKGTASGNSVTITKGNGTFTFSTGAEALNSTVTSSALSKGTWSGEYGADVKTIDASKTSGAITINTTGSSLTELSTGKKGDTVTINNSTMKTVNTNAGNDIITVDLAASGVKVDAGAGNDLITANAEAHKATLVLGAGKDTLHINSADLTEVDGSAGGNNTLNVNVSSTNSTKLNLGKGKDTLNFAAGVTGYKVTLGGGADVAAFKEGASATITDLDGKVDTIRLESVKEVTADDVNYASGKMTIYGGRGETKQVNEEVSVAEENTGTASGDTATVKFTANLLKFTAVQDSTDNTKYVWPSEGVVTPVEFTAVVNAQGTLNSLSMSESSTDISGKFDSTTTPSSGAVYYSGLPSTSATTSLTFANGIVAAGSTGQDAQNGKHYSARIEFTKVVEAVAANNTTTPPSEAKPREAGATITWTSEGTPLNITEVYLEGLSEDKLVKVVGSDGTVIYEQTPSAIAGTGNKTTYTLTNANTGSRLVLGDSVNNIISSKRTKAVNIVSGVAGAVGGAASIVSGSGADTISTFASEATVDAGTGADIYIVNASQTLLVDTFTLGTNTKKSDSLQFGRGIDTVVNATTAKDVEAGNAVLKFYGLDDDGKLITSTESVVTVRGGAWDGAASNRQIMIRTSDGSLSQTDTTGYGDIHVSVAAASSAGAQEVSDDKATYDKEAGKDIDTVTYFTASKALDVTAGELNVVGGKKGDTLIGRDQVYNVATISEDSGNAFYASDVAMASTLTNVTGFDSAALLANAYVDALSYNKPTAGSDLTLSEVTFTGLKGAEGTGDPTKVYIVGSGTKVSGVFLAEDAITDSSNNITGFKSGSILDLAQGNTPTDTESTLNLTFRQAGGSTSGFEQESNVKVSLVFQGSSLDLTPTNLAGKVNKSDTTYAALNGEQTYTYTQRQTPHLSTSDGGVGNDLLISNVRGGAFLGGAGNDTLKIGLTSATLGTRLSDDSAFADATDSGDPAYTSNVYVKGGAGNDTFLIDGLVGSAVIEDYSNPTATSHSDAKELKAVKKAQGNDKIVFAYDTYKTKDPQSRVTITSVGDASKKAGTILTLSDGSTVKNDTFDLTLTVKADAFNPNIGTADLGGTTTVVQGAGAFEGNAVNTDFDTSNAAGIDSYSTLAKTVTIKDVVIGDQLSVTYQGTTFNQTASLDNSATANGNYLGYLNPNATKITNTGKGGLLVGTEKITQITGSGKNDTLVSNNTSATTADQGTKLVGGEGKDVFDVRSGKANIDDYTSGDDRVLVDKFQTAIRSNITGTPGVSNDGIEAFGFQLTTAASAGVEASLQLDFTFDRNTVGTDQHLLTAYMNGTQVAQTTTTGLTNAFTAQDFKFGLGTNSFEVKLNQTDLKTGNDVSSYTLDITKINSVSDGSAQALSYSAGAAYSTITLTNAASQTLYAASDTTGATIFYSELDSDGAIVSTSKVDEGSTFWKIDGTSGYIVKGGQVLALNVTDATSTASTTTLSGLSVNGEVDLNDSFFTSRVTFAPTADGSNNAEGVTVNGKNLTYGNAYLKNAASNDPVTLFTATDTPTFKNGKYSTTKTVTHTEVRAYNSKATVINGGSSDIINVYGNATDAQVRLVQAGNKGTLITNSSNQVASIIGGKGADTIDTTSNGTERVTVKTNAGNDVITAEFHRYEIHPLHAVIEHLQGLKIGVRPQDFSLNDLHLDDSFNGSGFDPIGGTGTGLARIFELSYYAPLHSDVSDHGLSPPSVTFEGMTVVLVDINSPTEGQTAHFKH